MPPHLTHQLQAFGESHKFFSSKGALSVALVITRKAIENGLPLKPEDLVTGAKGQVLGLGRAAVQSILRSHGITRILASEGGRTSRGSIGRMNSYVRFLNDLGSATEIDLTEIEAWWVARVRDYFEAKPLKMKAEAGASLKACIISVFEEAKRRQSQNRGSTILGAVMQHLVGAQLQILYPNQDIIHNGYSVADGPTSRAGDFQLGDCVIHVTTAPSEQLLSKCNENIDQGLSPIIISTTTGAASAETLADSFGLTRRIETLDVAQFIVANMLERTCFDTKLRRSALKQLVDQYNEIVESCETDPSLKIELS